MFVCCWSACTCVGIGKKNFPQGRPSSASLTSGQHCASMVRTASTKLSACWQENVGGMRANLVASRCESRRQCAACGPNQRRSRAQFCSGLVSGLDKVDVSLVKECVLHYRSCGACVAGHGAWARWQGGGRNGVPRVRVGSVVGCGLDSNAVHMKCCERTVSHARVGALCCGVLDAGVYSELVPTERTTSDRNRV